MISTDTKFLQQIRKGYESDLWCKKLKLSSQGITGLEFREPEQLWYVADCLIVLRVPEVRETLFHLAHDALGHFGFDKSYKSP
jgi:hypothetical protein